MSDTQHHPDNVDPAAIELSKAGFRALEELDIASAEQSFRSILEFDSENCYAFVGLAECARKRRDLAEAVSWYQHCIANDESNEVSARGLIMCHAELGNHKEVIELYRRYAHLVEGNEGVMLKAADAFRRLHNTDMAALLYQSILELDGANRYALSGMGHLLYEEERYTESIKYWNRLLEHDNTSVVAHTCIGNCCRKLRNFQNGLEYYKRAAEMEPDNFYALFGMADCYRGLEHFDESLEYWKRILENDPKNRMILTRAGEASMRMHKPDDAEHYFQKALDQGEDLFALMGMARLAKNRGRLQEASAYYSRALELDGAKRRFGAEIQTFLDSNRLEH